MAETARGVGERRIDAVILEMPALSAALDRTRARPSTEEQALAYIRSIWPDALLGERCSSIRDFVLAEQAEVCHETCPGVKRCPNRGFRPTALCEPLGDGRRTFVVRWGLCSVRAVQDSQANAEKILQGARLPDRLKRCTFATYLTSKLAPDVLKAKGMALATIAEGNSLILAGSNGVGKTHLAAAMVNDRVESGRSALFISVPELLDDLRKAIASGRSTDAMDTVKKAEFLVMDDLGAERLTEWVGERLYMIVNHRYLSQLQTVITTNAENAADLVGRLGEQGERIVSRLVEMGAWCGVSAEDYRFMRKAPESGRGKPSRQGTDSKRQEVLADIPF
jgi:DNA replication protein DnaC